MDPVSHAIILAIIAALAVFLGGLENEAPKDAARQKPPAVQVICSHSPEKCPPGIDPGGLHAVEPSKPDGLLSPAEGNPDP